MIDMGGICKFAHTKAEDSLYCSCPLEGVILTVAHMAQLVCLSIGIPVLNGA